jgi:hypothetical protein
MIDTNQELEQAIVQMGRMQRILESYRADILPKNARNFAVFAEGPLDEIRKLQAEISDYVVRLENTPAAA